MQMQMKYGLLSCVPAREKESFSLGAKESPLPLRDLGAELKHGRKLFRSWIGEFHGMPFGNYKRMPFSQRTGGQKSNAQGILGNKGHGRTPGDNLTEDACFGSRSFVKRGHS
jgi:hypothetical protein